MNKKNKLEFPSIEIAGRKIGKDHPAFVIAEVSANHNQDFNEAIRIVKQAAKAGADAIKLQTYTPDTMTINSNKKWFYIGGKQTPASWKDKNLYNLYEGAYTPWEWHLELKKLVEDLGLIFFSTPFDRSAVDFLEEIDVPCYKIASYEATDLPLLKCVAKTKKPVILSVGFANLTEIEEAVETLKKNGTKQIALLHCVTSYSDHPSENSMNLKNIEDLQNRFGVVSGFSDNNSGIEFPIASIYAGASIVEKHFIVNKKSGSPDSRFSIVTSDFKNMVAGIRNAEKVLGKVQYGPLNENERNYKKLRRSVFVVKDIKAGERLTKNHIRVIRPEFGLPPKEYENLLGKKVRKNITAGTPMSRKHIY